MLASIFKTRFQLHISCDLQSLLTLQLHILLTFYQNILQIYFLIKPYKGVTKAINLPTRAWRNVKVEIFSTEYQRFKSSQQLKGNIYIERQMSYGSRVILHFIAPSKVLFARCKGRSTRRRITFRMFDQNIYKL